MNLEKLTAASNALTTLSNDLSEPGPKVLVAQEHEGRPHGQDPETLNQITQPIKEP